MSFPARLFRFAAPLVALLATIPLDAQTNSGSIAGTVLDPSGAGVPGAQIDAVEASTGTAYHTLSNASGSYTLPEVRIGRYNVAVTAPSFRKQESTGVQVQVGTVTPLDLRLEVGNVAETVTVSANAPTVQAESSDIGTVVEQRQVLELPLSAGGGLRSPQAFIFLTPGTVGPGTANGGGGSGISKISGGQNYATQVLLDGLSTYVDENGSTIDGTEPSVEALDEFKVITATPAAAYGRTTGGITTFATKSGSNSYHGALYDIFRNEKLDANTWFNNAYLAQNPRDPGAQRTFARPNDKKNDYGVALGGPVVVPHFYDGRNRSFFFFSWEQYRQNVGATITSTVPTLAQRNGDFSSLIDTTRVLAAVNPCNGQPIYAGQIFDPATTRTVGTVQCRDPFPANQIPANRVSNVATNVLNLWPKPINNLTTNNFSYASSNPFVQTTYTVRIDQNLGANSRLYFSYSPRENTSAALPAFPPPIAFAANKADFTAKYIRAGYDQVFSPRMLNHLVLGFNRWRNKDIAVAALSGTNWPARIGIGNDNATTFPQMSFGENLPLLGYPIDVDQIDNGLRLSDSFNWTIGSHTLKFGADWQYQEWSPIGYEGQSGYFNWNRGQTAGTSLLTGTSGNGLASFLLGAVHDANLTDHSYSQPQLRQPYYGFFIQDDWKATPTLTLNVGLRWDVEVPRHEIHGNSSNLSLTLPNPGAGGLPGALVFAGKGPGRNGNTNETFIHPYHGDWGPRIGFAWSPARFQAKTVFRGGYGILYGPLVYSDHGNNLQNGFTQYPSFSTLDGYAPAFNIDSGFPAYQHPPVIDPAVGNYATAYGGVSYLAPSFNKPGMVQNWSVQIQQQLAKDLLLGIGYVGQHSTRLRSNFSPTNNISPAQFALGSLLNAQTGSTRAAAAGIQAPFAGFDTKRNVAQAIRPYPQYLHINSDCCGENLGQSSYHSMQVSIERRFTNGLNLLGAYTWSKTLTDADSALPAFAAFAGGGMLQDAFNHRNEKSISNQDIPHTLVLSYLYELPAGKGKRFLSNGGVTNVVLGGWQVGAVHRYQSGQPYAFCCGTSIPGYNEGIRFDRVLGQSLWSGAKRSGHFNPLTDRVFNVNALADPNAGSRLNAGGAYRLGTMPRVTGEVRSDPFLNEDISLIKRTALTERVNLTFYAEFFNAFNRHVFGRANDLTIFGNTRDPVTQSFGQITNTIDSPRNIQLQLKLEF